MIELKKEERRKRERGRGAGEGIMVAYHERGPGHGGAKVVEEGSETHLGDDPSVTVIVDYGPIKVKYHHHSHSLSHGFPHSSHFALPTQDLNSKYFLKRYIICTTLFVGHFLIYHLFTIGYSVGPS